ncbi:integrase [Pseudoalteromonas espejiana DSM 9414]|uniref:Site-specific integrase n=2 Tax=Pseudoalteromonas espejiana TaxID=28107 RepID=A0A510XYE6_9GAMM|nr:integrase [Pseudoalteromonas espejiana DSM 9414]GEK56073.1 site-specific integrase [Pseudoalteromonas espejiana]
MAICHDVEHGRFNYIEAFPNSKTALALIKNDASNTTIQLNLYLDKFIADSKANNRPKTHQNNNYRTEKYIRPLLGERCMKSIKVSEIKEWINKDLAHLANKTISEVLTPLRTAYRFAIEDKLITENPMDFVKNPNKEKCDEADPYTQSEITKLMSTDTEREIERDALTFAIWTGLRPSELLAVSLCDIDFEKRKLYVNRGVVRGVLASTKNDGSSRCIDLLDEAFDILLNLVNRTDNFRFFKVKVLQANNRLFDDKDLQFIFTSSKSKSFWTDSESFDKMFVKPHCKAAGVRYRPIGQARHTYGSQLITAGIPLNWISKQMGHSSIKMLEKHYGRWMESEMPDMAAQVSRKLKQKQKQKSDNDPS